MLSIPTIGIGSGAGCNAQVLVMHDLLGLYPDAPPFAKRYAELAQAATEGFRAFARDVRDGTFPVDTPNGAAKLAEADVPAYAIARKPEPR
jgi:ketopantoate hydroxymethyltransferase